MHLEVYTTTTLLTESLGDALCIEISFIECPSKEIGVFLYLNTGGTSLRLQSKYFGASGKDAPFELQLLNSRSNL